MQRGNHGGRSPLQPAIDALDRTWEWIDNDLTLVTIPGAGHFIQQDATEMVSRSILAWLNR